MDVSWPRTPARKGGGRTRRTCGCKVKSILGCSVTDRESPWVALLTGTWRARASGGAFHCILDHVGDRGLRGRRVRCLRAPYSLVTESVAILIVLQAQDRGSGDLRV